MVCVKLLFAFIISYKMFLYGDKFKNGINETFLSENDLHILQGPPIPKVIFHVDLLISSTSYKKLSKFTFPSVNSSNVKSITLLLFFNRNKLSYKDIVL